MRDEGLVLRLWIRELSSKALCRQALLQRALGSLLRTSYGSSSPGMRGSVVQGIRAALLSPSKDNLRRPGHPIPTPVLSPVPPPTVDGRSGPPCSLGKGSVSFVLH